MYEEKQRRLTRLCRNVFVMSGSRTTTNLVTVRIDGQILLTAFLLRTF